MEWMAISIGIGLIISLWFTEVFGLCVGGMIVPGYLAMSLNKPATVFMTLIAALATAWFVQGLDHWMIVFGRRRVVITMVVGFAVASLMRVLFSMCFSSANALTQNSFLPAQLSLEALRNQLAGVTIIGFVIPGLIALWIGRSGATRTIAPLLVATVMVHLILVAVGLVPTT